MPSRDETMVEMPAITPDRDEIVSRRVAGASSGRRGGKNAPKTPTGGGQKETTVLMVLFIISLLVGLGGLVWAFTLQQKIINADVALQASMDRIKVLEDQISSTDESVDKSSTALQIQLNELDKQNKKAWEQIDQLWGSAWRKNQAEIKENKEALAKSNTQLEKQLAEQKTLTNNLKNTVDSYPAAIEKVNSRLSAIDAKGTYRQNQLEGLSIHIEQVAADLHLQNSRLTDSEEWIKAINSHRQQINKSLDVLQKNMRELQANDRGQAATPTFQ